MQLLSLRVLRSASAVALALVMAALGAVPAHAQRPTLDLQLFQPTLATGTTFTLDRPEVPRHLSIVAGLGVNGAAGLLERQDGESIAPWRVQADLLFALGLFEWVELGVALPVVFGATGQFIESGPIRTDTHVSLGDVRIGFKVPILRGQTALSARIEGTLPSGGRSTYARQRYWSLTPALVFAHHAGDFTFGADLAYRFRDRSAVQGFEFDDELQVKLGASYRVVPLLALVAETHLRAGLGGRTRRANEFPMEVEAGVRLFPSAAWTIDVGAGTGVLAGYGAPQVRGFVIVRYSNEREPCAAGPEDFDGFEDGDFCAELDNDADGLEDTVDACPNDPEDMDGFADDDGCPDVDNDADGIPDDTDTCPLESEDHDEYQDEDGCPEPDNDGDGIADGADQCPMEPEDRDNYQDDDGCPEPGPGQATVTVTDTRILISERIYFDFDTSEIRSVSLPLLDQVADVIRSLPGRRRIRVEGYTDSEGDDSYNADLSYTRARAVVDYLVGRGVNRERLLYEGYGERNPVAPNDSPEGRALNRRVEFTIMPD
ncbi:MAG: OmpA family protein [Sandaracinaceae bacterium]|nr:OmpA family protein [Myxococcales bacterium]MCB9661474.1 OmpA family protein [Sandaracinaceae bacterium]